MRRCPGAGQRSPHGQVSACQPADERSQKGSVSERKQTRLGRDGYQHANNEQRCATGLSRLHALAAGHRGWRLHGVRRQCICATCITESGGDRRKRRISHLSGRTLRQQPTGGKYAARARHRTQGLRLPGGLQPTSTKGGEHTCANRRRHGCYVIRVGSRRQFTHQVSLLVI